MRWFRPRPQPVVLRAVQMRVVLVDPDLDDGPGPSDPDSAPDRVTLVPDSTGSAISVAPPLAVRPVEDADWTFRN